MPVTVIYEEESCPSSSYENCCFCFEATPCWTNVSGRKPGEQVACCEDCAEEYRVKDVPSKEYWCAMVRRMGTEYMRGRQDMNHDHYKRLQLPK